MKEWCDCMDMYKPNFIECEPKWWRKEWKYCPICGAERPKEPTKLWEKLKTNHGHIFDYIYRQDEPAVNMETLEKQVANTTIDEFIKIINESATMGSPAAEAYKNIIIKQLEELR